MKPARKKTASSGNDIVLSRDNPVHAAEQFRSLRRPHLIRQQREWLDYNDGVYSAVEDDTIMAEILAFATEAKQSKLMLAPDPVSGKMIRTMLLVPLNPQPRDVENIYKTIANQVHKARDKNPPPCWLDGRAGPDPKDIVCVENGLLNIITRELLPHTPAFFTRTKIPLVYESHAPKPTRWLNFLDEVFDSRAELAALLQEVIGYKLSSDTKRHAVFFYIGQSRSGKGTIARIEAKLIGQRNIANPNIEDLAGRFWAEDLIGKSNLVVTDASCSNKSHVETAGNRINAISGEDPVDAQRKGRTNWNGTLTARCTLISNKYPDFGKHADAMINRAIVLPFDVTFAGREDRLLTEKLATELSGILNWCLDGLDRLRERGEFLEPEVSKRAKMRMKHIADPVHAFLEECCVMETGAGIDKDLLYAVYTAHSEHNRTKVVDLPTLSERLREINPSVSPSKRRRKDRPQLPIYRGIRLTDDMAGKWYVLDGDALALGFTPGEPLSLVRDVDGWPIPRSVPEFS